MFRVAVRNLPRFQARVQVSSWQARVLLRVPVPVLSRVMCLAEVRNHLWFRASCLRRCRAQALLDRRFRRLCRVIARATPLKSQVVHQAKVWFQVSVLFRAASPAMYLAEVRSHLWFRANLLRLVPCLRRCRARVLLVRNSLHPFLATCQAAAFRHQKFRV